MSEPGFECFNCGEDIEPLKYTQELGPSAEDPKSTVCAVTFCCPYCRKIYWLTQEGDTKYGIAEMTQ